MERTTPRPVGKLLCLLGSGESEAWRTLEAEPVPWGGNETGVASQPTPFWAKMLGYVNRPCPSQFHAEVPDMACRYNWASPGSLIS